MAKSIFQESLKLTGLPGATAGSRYVGGTVAGAPTSGTFAVGDFIVDQSGAMWVCTVAGTPGTWQLSGVSVNENIAGKNFLINGGMDIWQRGTSFSVASVTTPYTADRWQTLAFGTNTITCSQVTANVKTTSTSSVTIGTGSLSFTISTGLVIAAGQGFEAYYTSGTLNAVYGTVTSYNSSTGVLVANITNTIGSGTYAAWTVTVATLPQFNYALRTQRNSGNTSTGAIYQAQTVETSNSIPLAGKTITLSFWMRVGANFSGSTMTVGINAGFGNDGNVIAGMTGSVSVILSSCTPTTSWQLFTFNGTVPSGATQIGLSLSYTPSGTAGAADYFDITGLQIEIGNTATPFSRAGGSIGGELSLCQRYFYKVYSQNAASVNEKVAIGQATSTTAALFQIPLPVTMRTAPTGAISSLGASSFAIVNSSNTNASAVTSLSYESTTPNNVSLSTSLGGSWLSTGNAALLIGNSAGWYLGFSAEL